jgi:chromosome segregation ATPase
MKFRKTDLSSPVRIISLVVMLVCGALWLDWSVLLQDLDEWSEKDRGYSVDLDSLTAVRVHILDASERSDTQSAEYEQRASILSSEITSLKRQINNQDRNLNNLRLAKGRVERGEARHLAPHKIQETIEHLSNQIDEQRNQIERFRIEVSDSQSELFRFRQLAINLREESRSHRDEAREVSRQRQTLQDRHSQAQRLESDYRQARSTIELSKLSILVLVMATLLPLIHQWPASVNNQPE